MLRRDETLSPPPPPLPKTIFPFQRQMASPLSSFFFRGAFLPPSPQSWPKRLARIPFPFSGDVFPARVSFPPFLFFCDFSSRTASQHESFAESLRGQVPLLPLIFGDRFLYVLKRGFSLFFLLREVFPLQKRRDGYIVLRCWCMPLPRHRAFPLRSLLLLFSTWTPFFSLEDKELEGGLLFSLTRFHFPLSRAFFFPPKPPLSYPHGTRVHPFPAIFFFTP